jgi:hypothetical protein
VKLIFDHGTQTFQEKIDNIDIEIEEPQDIVEVNSNYNQAEVLVECQLVGFNVFIHFVSTKCVEKQVQNQVFVHHSTLQLSEINSLTQLIVNQADDFLSLLIETDDLSTLEKPKTSWQENWYELDGVVKHIEKPQQIFLIFVVIFDVNFSEKNYVRQCPQTPRQQREKVKLWRQFWKWRSIDDIQRKALQTKELKNVGEFVQIRDTFHFHCYALEVWFENEKRNSLKLKVLSTFMWIIIRSKNIRILLSTQVQTLNRNEWLYSDNNWT